LEEGAALFGVATSPQVREREREREEEVEYTLWSVRVWKTCGMHCGDVRNALCKCVGGFGWVVTIPSLQKSVLFWKRLDFSSLSVCCFVLLVQTPEEYRYRGLPQGSPLSPVLPWTLKGVTRPLFSPSQVNDSNEGSSGPVGCRSHKLHSEEGWAQRDRPKPRYYPSLGYFRRWLRPAGPALLFIQTTPEVPVLLSEVQSVVCICS